MPELKRNFIDRAIEFVSPERAIQRYGARVRIEAASGSLFRGSSTDRLRSDWVTSNQKDTTPFAWELDKLRQRSRDLNRNDPVASAATDTMGLNIIGQGLRPQSQIRAAELGIDKARVSELQRQAERVWQLFVPTADSRNCLTFNEIQFLALRKIVEDGEIIALPIFAREPWRKIGRAVELIEADRLGGAAVQKLKANIAGDTGIEVGPRGEPVRYWLKKADYTSLFMDTSEYVGMPARDAKGRPMVLHVYPSKRPGQLRGIPMFAPVLNYFKDVADYLEAEVVTARVAACLGIFITKQNPMDAAWMNQTSTGTNGDRIQALQPGMVNYLGINESIQVVDPKRPGDTFPAFMESCLRLIGNSLGLPYELFFKDFSKTNYSSARAALLEGRRMFMQWRVWFAERFTQPIWELVLEEAYLKGLFDVPDFYENKAEYCRCTWVGGAWGWVDPVKEVEASKLAIDYGLSTMAEEAAGQGRDWEEVLEQRAREQEKAKELKLDLSGAKGQKPEVGGQKPEVGKDKEKDAGTGEDSETNNDEDTDDEAARSA